MRYLSSISLAFIVLMALACTATPATLAPTPSGPMYSEEEAIAVLKAHLQAKPIRGEWQGITCFTLIDGEVDFWSARYDNEAHRWDVTIKSQAPKQPEQPGTKYYTWSVYERTKSIVATGDEWLNQVC